MRALVQDPVERFTPTNPTGFTTKGSKSKVALLLPRLNGEKLESNRVPAAKDACCDAQRSQQWNADHLFTLVVVVVS